MGYADYSGVRLWHLSEGRTGNDLLHLQNVYAKTLVAVETKQQQFQSVA
jgi:hypothetical protein